MRAGDRMRNLGQRRINLSGIFETVLGHDDHVGLAAPLTHQASAWPEAEIAQDHDAPTGLQLSRQCYEFALYRFGQAAIGEFLKAIGDRADQQITAQSRRLTAIKPAPFIAELLRCQIMETCDPPGQITCLCQISACSNRRLTVSGRSPGPD